MDSATAITDVEMSDTAGSSQPEIMNALPAIIPGSEPWHQHFPNDWLPIITRDVQKQSQVFYTNYYSMYIYIYKSKQLYYINMHVIQLDIYNDQYIYI